MEKTNLKIENRSIEEIGLNNIPDYLAPNWNNQKIVSQNNQEFDQIFQIDNIPLSWFYKRLLSFHTIPPQFQTKPLIKKFLEREEITKKKELEKKQKRLQKLYYINEKIKIAFYRKKKTNTNSEKPNVLFLTFLDHTNQESKIFRLNNLINIIKKDPTFYPLTITITPPSKRFYSTIQKQYNCENNFYYFIKKEHKKQAKKVAKELSNKWQSLSEKDKIDLFQNSSLWNCLRYPFEFYYSYEFIYTIALCYYTYKNIIKENNIKIAVITSQHNIYERCLNAVASENNIPTFLIQHGAGMGSLKPQLLPPYKIAVFSDYYKQLLIEQNVLKENIFVTGPLIFDDIYPFLSKNPNRSRAAGHSLTESIGIFTLENGSQQSCGVLDPFSLNKNKIKNISPKILILTVPFIEQEYLKKEEYFDYIKKIINELQQISCQITVKLHPREKTIKDYIKLKNYYHWLNVEIIQKTDSSYLYNLMSKSDIIINFSSTTALEAMILDKPLITIIFDNFKNPFNTLLNESKATLEVDSKKDISIAVKELLVKDNLSNQRRFFINKICGIIDGKASEHVAIIFKRIYAEK